MVQDSLEPRKILTKSAISKLESGLVSVGSHNGFAILMCRSAAKSSIIHINYLAKETGVSVQTLA